MPAATLYVSMSFVAFSVTTNILPLVSNPISAGPTPMPLSGALEFATGRSHPLREMWKPADRAAAGVEDEEQIAMNGQADRLDAPGSRLYRRIVTGRRRYGSC